MSTFLKPLTDIKTPDLIEFDRDSLVAEIVERIQADPNWNSIWDGELVHNFAYFIINTFSYLFSKNAETANRIIRETFITQAKDPLSIINYLSNFSLNLKQNTASMAEVTIRPNDGGSFTFPFTLDPGFSLTATTINNNQINYEIYNLELDQYGNETDKINYGSSIEVPASNFYKVKAFSGTTIIKTLEIDPITQTEKFIYNITDTDIIENSIRIYYQYGIQNQQEELIETDSFVVNPKITNTFTEAMGGVPHYKIKYNTDGSAKIIFGSREFGGSFPPLYGKTLTFFYRTGGGTLSNIQRGGINNVIDLVIDNYNTIPLSFYNLLGGGGGGDRETLDEAQFYAPYRIGRSRSIIDETDALNELRNSVIKHLVKSPKYNGINVPVLHYHNYIVPPRDFNNFKFPIPNSTDNYLTYKNVFELELNKFLNLDGIHDGSENDILISFFRNTNFNFPLPYKPPLNGSLYISAYNSSGKEIDRLVWGSNYSGTNILPDLATSKAFVESTNPIVNLNVTPDFNYLYFNIDDQIGDYTAPDTGLTYFKIEITPVSYEPTGLAQEINNKIKSINYYNSFGTSAQFAYINSNNKLVITSLTAGINSKVKLFNIASDSILNTIGLSETYIDAAPQNRTVFREDSIYDYQNHKISVSLNTNNQKTKYYYNEISNWTNVDDPIGPIIYLSFKDENNNIIYAQEGEDLIVICKNSNNSVADSLTFSNVSSLGDNTGVISNDGNGNVFDDSDSTLCKYNYSTGEIIIKLTDSNGEDGSYSFPVSEDNVTELYNTGSYFEVIYQNKTFSFLTVSMIPNPYLPESEALQYSLKLKSKDKKMIGIEPLLKKVIFKPLLLDISVNPLKGYSREQAIRDTTNLIYNNFTYNTMLNEVSIGTGLSLQTIESFLNNKSLLQSIEKAKVTLPVSDLLDPNENTYYFIFDLNFLGRIKKFEETYTQLVGLHDSYKLKIKIA